MRGRPARAIRRMGHFVNPVRHRRPLIATPRARPPRREPPAHITIPLHALFNCGNNVARAAASGGVAATHRGGKGGRTPHTCAPAHNRAVLAPRDDARLSLPNCSYIDQGRRSAPPRRPRGAPRPHPPRTGACGLAAGHRRAGGQHRTNGAHTNPPSSIAEQPSRFFRRHSAGRISAGEQGRVRAGHPSSTCVPQPLRGCLRQDWQAPTLPPTMSRITGCRTQTSPHELRSRGPICHAMLPRTRRTR